MYTLRAAWGTIMASRTRYAIKAKQSLACLFDGILLQCSQRLEVLHVREVVGHLLFVGHSTEHDHHIVERRYKADSP